MTEIKRLYNELPDYKKTKVRDAWCSKFKLSTRQFSNRLQNPKAADYPFFSSIMEVPLHELMQSLIDKTISSSLLQNDSQILATELFLTK